MESRIEKHENACKKSNKKRKVYISTMHRVPDDEAAKKIVMTTLKENNMLN